MEVLGAVASSIAVVQALAAGKHVVSIVREVPGIQDDFNYLMKELTLIKSMVEAISRMPPSAYEQALMNAAAEDLSEVTHELESLLRSCAHEVDTKDSKVYKTRKRKWLLEKGAVTKLQQRMANAKNTLHFAVTSSRATNDVQFQAYIRQMFINFCAIHALHNNTSATSSHDEPEIDQQTDSSGASALEAIDVNNHEGKVQMAEPVSIQPLTHIQSVSSSTSCQCSCHFTKTQYQNSGWVESLFGSWLVRCKNRPQKKCSNPDCQCLSSSVLKLEYRVPRWLFSQSIAIVASYNNIGGLRCSLRPCKLLEMVLPLLACQEGSSQLIRESVVRYGVYPGDTDMCGMGLIEVRNHGLGGPSFYDSDSPNLWGNLLPEVELNRGIANYANHLVSVESLHDHEIYLLQKLVRLIGHQSRETTRIHIAIRRREGLQAALQEQSWAINTIDYTGHCPITLAADIGQIGCIKMLLSAGADVNQLTSRGKSALILATQRGALESVRLLLNAKCRVDWTDLNGLTALHFASSSQCVESVSLLLAAGATAARRNVSGPTPLHMLACNETNNRGDAKRTIELLVLAGNDLEERDTHGATPFVASLISNKIGTMRCLLDLGGSPSWSNSNDQNTLHVAAMFATLEMLEYLGTLDLYDINPYQKDFLGLTPGHWFFAVHDRNIFGIRTRSTAEMSAFLNLCQGIKDRSLQHEIDNIEQVVAGLRNRDVATARKHLGLLLAREEHWNSEDLVCWYRAVDKRIENLEWDLATEDLNDYLTELKEELGTPVYDVPSRYGCRFLDSQTWEITIWESEASESETSE